MIDQLPMLLIVVPLLGALLCVLVGNGDKPWAVATIVMTLVAIMSVILLVDVGHKGVVSYLHGNWPAKWGIEYRIDALNSFVLAIVACVAAVMTFSTRLSVKSDIPSDRYSYFYCLWMLAITGLLGLTITGDAFNLYVLLELSAVASYVLVAMGRYKNRQALTASFRYLILGSVGASFILLGIGYLLMTTGTLNMLDMAEYLRQLPGGGASSRTVLVAFALIMVGVSLKVALFPLHAWLPGAYTYAPSAVSSLLASIATQVGAYVALRFLYTIFGADFSFELRHVQDSLMLLASAGVVFASVQALKQKNVKRILAYSSMAQIAYILLGVSMNNKAGLTGSIVHMFNHALIIGTMFLAVSAVMSQVGACRIDDLRGLGKKMPYSMAAFTIGGLGLIGFPFTAGFVSKWYLIQGALQAGFWWCVVVLVFGALTAMAYVWRMVEAIYFSSSNGADEKIVEAPMTQSVPALLLALASLYFGSYAVDSVGFAERAVVVLGISQ